MEAWDSWRAGARHTEGQRQRFLEKCKDVSWKPGVRMCEVSGGDLGPGMRRPRSSQPLQARPRLPPPPEMSGSLGSGRVSL